jgi:transposase
MVATACLKNVHQYRLRLMFQDEARFGRLSDPRTCWAPAPLRPIVKKALIREYKYEYAAVSPWDGQLDYMTSEKMNTESMNYFLKQVSQAHSQEYIVMILDGASSHKCKELQIPEEMALLYLPPYSPELNPTEQIWNVLRRNSFANKVFDSLEAATSQAENGLAQIASNSKALKSLTNWRWINDILNAV